MNAQEVTPIEQLFQKLLKPLWAGVVLGYLICIVAIIFWPAVKAVSPDFYTKSPTIHPLVVSQEISPKGRAFTERPLFLPSRRPPSGLENNPALTANPEVGSSTLEGIQIVGMFSSEAGQGVILVDKGSVGIRLTKGQTYEGWTFIGIEGVTAFFSNANGARVQRRLLAPGEYSSAPISAPSRRGSAQVDIGLTADELDANSSAKARKSSLTLNNLYEQEAANRRSAQEGEGGQQ